MCRPITSTAKVSRKSRALTQRSWALLLLVCICASVKSEGQQGVPPRAGAWAMRVKTGAVGSGFFFVRLCLCICLWHCLVLLAGFLPAGQNPASRTKTSR